MLLNAASGCFETLLEHLSWVLACLQLPNLSIAATAQGLLPQPGSHSAVVSRSWVESRTLRGGGIRCLGGYRGTDAELEKQQEFGCGTTYLPVGRGRLKAADSHIWLESGGERRATAREVTWDSTLGESKLRLQSQPNLV